MTNTKDTHRQAAPEYSADSPTKRPLVNYALWAVQALLALVFLFAGGAKLVLSAEALRGPVAVPVLFLRFIGVCEVLGALGLILPGLLRIQTGLTPLAAGGLVIIMIGATIVNVVGGGVAPTLITLVVGLLAASVAYGRWKLVPHRGRSSSNGHSRLSAISTGS